MSFGPAYTSATIMLAIPMGSSFYEKQIKPKWEWLRSGGKVDIGAKSRVAFGTVFDLSQNGTVRTGRECVMSRGAIIAPYGGEIVLGDRVSVNSYTILYGHGGLTIGNDVRIAAHCVIVPANHRFDDPNLPIKRQGMSQLGITIEDDVWIGANVVVLDGTHICKGCVIGAGSVVRGHLEPMTIYAGSPTRKIGSRADGDDRRYSEENTNL